MSNQTKLMSIQEVNDFRIEVSKIKSLEEINELHGKLVEESKNFSFPVAELGQDNLKNIIKFFENVENIPFNLTAPVIACYDKLKALKAKDAVEYGQLKVIQTILVGASWSAKPESKDPLSEGRDLLSCLKALEPANILLGRIESKIQITGARIVEIEQEIETGLQYKDAAIDDTTKLVEEAVAEEAAK